jgi:hypothetical protein
VQCLSGTGSLRVGAEFLCRVLNYQTAYVSKPTWGNHKLVFNNGGFKSVVDYRYWDATNHRIDIDGLVADLEAAPEKSVIVLHGCAHNPTGMDPTQDQWKKICEVVKVRLVCATLKGWADFKRPVLRPIAKNIYIYIPFLVIGRQNGPLEVCTAVDHQSFKTVQRSLPNWFLYCDAYRSLETCTLLAIR